MPAGARAEFNQVQVLITHPDSTGVSVDCGGTAGSKWPSKTPSPVTLQQPLQQPHLQMWHQQTDVSLTLSHPTARSALQGRADTGSQRAGPAVPTDPLQSLLRLDHVSSGQCVGFSDTTGTGYLESPRAPAGMIAAMAANASLLCSPWSLWSSSYVDLHHRQTVTMVVRDRPVWQTLRWLLQGEISGTDWEGSKRGERQAAKESCSLSTLMPLFLNLAFPGLLSPTEQQPCLSLEIFGVCFCHIWLKSNSSSRLLCPS